MQIFKLWKSKVTWKETLNAHKKEISSCDWTTCNQQEPQTVRKQQQFKK